ncbi:Uncharacterized protein FWK35_00030624 [Aphis craccivora]|uniref:Uncharacterized protein n=1 Tax=Aphis craccivora TaxID=307492 RepID=A0A6G0VQW4_APHCR|nr:Uncharacterized protein FWK35_00030624 [Aphis craccivora]
MAKQRLPGQLVIYKANIMILNEPNYRGGFRCKSEYPWCIIEFSKKPRKTKKKMTEKREFLRKFSTKSETEFFLWFVDNKFLDDQKIVAAKVVLKTRQSLHVSDSQYHFTIKQ